jgi:hypothetical protein
MEPPDDDGERVERIRGERERIARMVAEMERERNQRPAPPGPGLAIGVFGVALAIYLLVSAVPRDSFLIGLIGFMVAYMPVIAVTMEDPHATEPGPQRRTGLWAFALLCAVGRAVPSLRHWDRFGVAAVAAALLAAGYVVVNRVRLRHWSPSWEGGWLGAAQRWAGLRPRAGNGDIPDGTVSRPWPVPVGEASRLGLYLLVGFGLAGVVSTVIVGRADSSFFGAALAVSIFAGVVHRGYRRRLRLWSVFVAGVAAAYLPILIAHLLGAPVDRHAWWQVATTPAEIALGIAGYALVTRLPERRRRLDSI